MAWGADPGCAGRGHRRIRVATGRRRPVQVLREERALPLGRRDTARADHQRQSETRRSVEEPLRASLSLRPGDPASGVLPRYLRTPRHLAHLTVLRREDCDAPPGAGRARGRGRSGEAEKVRREAEVATTTTAPANVHGQALLAIADGKPEMPSRPGTVLLSYEEEGSCAGRRTLTASWSSREEGKRYGHIDVGRCRDVKKRG